MKSWYLHLFKPILQIETCLMHNCHVSPPSHCCQTLKIDNMPNSHIHTEDDHQKEFKCFLHLCFIEWHVSWMVPKIWLPWMTCSFVNVVCISIFIAVHSMSSIHTSPTIHMFTLMLIMLHKKKPHYVIVRMPRQWTAALIMLDTMTSPDVVTYTAAMSCSLSQLFDEGVLLKERTHFL